MAEQLCNDLDGLPILILQEGRFWPAKVDNTQLEGVFTVVIERARQSKPIIMARDDILRDSVNIVWDKFIFEGFL